jgi:hypothetical protein
MSGLREAVPGELPEAEPTGDGRAAGGAATARTRAGRRFPVGLAVSTLGILALYVFLALQFAGMRSIWSPDCGARLIQVLSLQRHWPEWWITYPGEALDPNWQNSPLGFYEYHHDGRTYIFYSFLFALISGGLFRQLGYFGLAVLPILGGMTAALSSYGMARALRLRFPLVPMLLTALATPMLHYSVVFWDPAVTAGLATAALFAAVQAVKTGRAGLWTMSGMLVGLGLWFHEIILPLVPGLVLGAIYVYRRKALFPAALVVIGVALLVLPLAAINTAVYGTPMGPHLHNNQLGSGTAILRQVTDPTFFGPGAFYTLFGWGFANPGYTWDLKQWILYRPEVRHEMNVSLLMAVPIVLWAWLGLSGAWSRRGWWVVSLLLFAGMVADGVWVMLPETIPHSVFHACPVLALAFGGYAALRGRNRTEGPAAASDPVRRLPGLIGLMAVVHTIVTVLSPALGGGEWGTRFLLISTPIMSLFAAAALEHVLPPPGGVATPAAWRPGTPGLLAGMAALLVTTLIVQGIGIDRVMGIHRANRRIADDLLKVPEPAVVSTAWWAALNAAPVWYDKQFFFAGDALHPAPALFSRMDRADVRGYVLLGASPLHLSDFARAAGYLPDEGSVRQTGMHLVLCRYWSPPPVDPTAIFGGRASGLIRVPRFSLPRSGAPAWNGGMPPR